MRINLLKLAIKEAREFIRRAEEVELLIYQNALSEDVKLRGGTDKVLNVKRSSLSLSRALANLRKREIYSFNK